MRFIDKLKFYQTKPTKLSGCIFIGLIFLLCTALTLSLPWIYNTVEVLANRNKWAGQGISDYRITVRNSTLADGVTVSVHDGQIVAVNDPYSTDLVEENDFVRYRMYTVEDLFDAASHCVILCQRTFDAQYGFPKQIYFSGFIESGSYYEVVGFEAIPPNE